MKGSIGPERAPSLVDRGRAIIVGTAFDDASVVALRRAFDLSRRFAARLHLVHALPWSSPPLIESEQAVRRAVAGWAVEKARIVVAESDIVVDVDRPARALARAAVAADAGLIVIGSSRAGGTRTATELARPPTRAVLVAKAPRRRHELVAATDLRDRRFLVVHTAAAMAEACAARVTLVHNVEQDTSEQGPTRPLGPSMRELVRLASELQPIRGAHLAVLPSTTLAISAIVQARSADIVVVGARRGHGHTLASVLASTSSSVLAVPLTALQS